MSPTHPPTTSRRLARALLGPLQLAAIIFFNVSGGPFGLEPIFRYASGTAVITILIITPLLWAWPVILMVLELNSMLPIEGGYYQWVKQGLGLRWAFYEGWWSWLYTFTDLAIYPVLFVQYLLFFFPEAGPFQYPICLSVIWISAVLNIAGALPVGRASSILTGIVTASFIVLFSLFVTRSEAVATATQAQAIRFAPFGMAIYTVMWNFLGWDNVTSFVEEVRAPAQSYLKAIVLAFILILVLYLLAAWVGIHAGVPGETLADEGFPVLGTKLAGHWMGAFLAAGGMASALGLFMSILLAIARIPMVMANDGLISPAFSRVHSTFGTPYISIIVCAIIVSGMVLWELPELLIIDVTLYGMGVMLEFAALIMLRKRQPDTARPFTIPLGVPGLILLAALPAACIAIALIAGYRESEATLRASFFALAAVLSAPVAWLFVRRRQPSSENQQLPS